MLGFGLIRPANVEHGNGDKAGEIHIPELANSV